MSSGRHDARVHVRVPASLRSCVGGGPRVDVEVAALGEAPTVGALLDHLAEVHPDLERRLRDEQRRLRRHVNLFLGDANIRDLAEQDTPLASGAEVAIMPAVSGG
ncbi:MAG TPA: MoaD/ThiS family protein [Acidimicrobiales bacterium]|nr:MoaD/ThiS family protein [Acidimicrobiales bacterium]